MDATMVTDVKTKRLRARSLTALALPALIFASAFFASTAHSRQPTPYSSSDYIYVQAPSLSTTHSRQYQPVISPAPVGDAEWDHVGHLWPRMVSYSMETDAVQAFMQPDLKIGMQYNYSFNFELNARNGQGRAIAIPEGWYQLQIAVIRKANNGLKGKSAGSPYDRYVTSSSLFLRVSNGSFGRKISLRFPNITATSIKQHLFIELIPLREDCDEGRCINLNAKGEPDALRSRLEPRPGFKTYLVEMPFTPFQPSGGKVRDADDLNEKDTAFLDGSLAQYIARAQLHKNREALVPRQASSPAAHAEKNKLYLKSLSDPAFAPAEPALRELLNERSMGVLKLGAAHASIFATLCEQLVAHQAEFQERHRAMPYARARAQVIKHNINRCAADPEKYMRLSRVLHVGRPVASKVERIAQKSLTYTLMANFMSNRNRSTDVVSTVSMKLPAIVVQVLDQVGLGAGHTVNFVNGRSNIESGLASMSTSLDFNYVVFNVPTTGSRQCLEVRPLQDPHHMFLNRQENAKNGLYICGPKESRVIEIPEVYAHAFERCKDTTMMECDSLSQSVNLSLRGEREISAFFYAIRGGITPDHNNRVMPFGDIQGAEKFFANTPLIGDMEIVTPVEFPREKIPSFVQQMSGSYREIFN